MAGFADVPGTENYRLLSKRWCQQGPRVANDHSKRGENTHVIAIDGNFDDAQTNVKHMFNDVALREKIGSQQASVLIS